MPHPSFEGLTSKPVMPRTLVVTYPDLEGHAKADLSDGWLSSLKHVVKPNPEPAVAIEVTTGKVVELGIDKGAVMISPGIWECHLELELSGEPLFAPGIAVTGVTGTEVYFEYDKRALLGVSQDRHSISFIFFVDTYREQRLLLHVTTGGPEKGNFRDMRLSIKKIGSR